MQPDEVDEFLEDFLRALGAPDKPDEPRSEDR
jgi:hypothetical protein